MGSDEAALTRLWRAKSGARPSRWTYPATSLCGTFGWQRDDGNVWPVRRGVSTCASRLGRPEGQHGRGFIELGRLTRRLAVHESVRPASVEAQHPVPDDLKPDAADLAASVRVAPS